MFAAGEHRGPGDHRGDARQWRAQPGDGRAGAVGGTCARGAERDEHLRHVRLCRGLAVRCRPAGQERASAAASPPCCRGIWASGSSRRGSMRWAIPNAASRCARTSRAISACICSRIAAAGRTRCGASIAAPMCARRACGGSAEVEALDHDGHAIAVCELQGELSFVEAERVSRRIGEEQSSFRSSSRHDPASPRRSGGRGVAARCWPTMLREGGQSSGDCEPRCAVCAPLAGAEGYPSVDGALEVFEDTLLARVIEAEAIVPGGAARGVFAVRRLDGGAIWASWSRT